MRSLSRLSRPRGRAAAWLTLVLAGVLATGFGVAGAAGAFGATAASAAGRSAPGSAGWPQPGGDLGSTRFSQLTQVNTGNVKNLQVAWAMSMCTDRGLEGQPLLIGSTMYTVSAYPNYVTAINLANQRILWKYVPPEEETSPIAAKGAAVNTACCDVVNRGPAFWSEKLHFLTLDGHLTALNVPTGNVMSQMQNANPNIAQTCPAMLLVINAKV